MKGSRLPWRGDEEGTKPEAAFFEVQERLLRDGVGPQDVGTGSPLPRAKARRATSAITAAARCQLSWRGKSGEKAKDMRVVPAAVGTTCGFDARSSDSGRVTARRQRSEMHRFPGPSWRCSSRFLSCVLRTTSYGERPHRHGVKMAPSTLNGAGLRMMGG